MSDIFYKGEYQKVLSGDYGVDIADDSVTLDSRQLYRIIEARNQVTISFFDVEFEETRSIQLPTGFTLFGKFKELEVTSASGEIRATLGEGRPLKYTITPKGIIKYTGTEGVGDTFDIEGKTYTVVDDTTIRNYDPDMDDMTALCTTLVTDMGNLFANKFSFNQDISRWDTSNVTTMVNMFFSANQNGSFNQPIGNWDTSNVTNMSAMFSTGTDNFFNAFNQYIGDWDVSKVTFTDFMFFGCKNFNQDLSKWDVSNVSTMESMFDGATLFNQPLNSWNTSNVTTMDYMFSNSNFNRPLDNWDTSLVTQMEWMFRSTPFNQDISMWDTSSVVNMNQMFTFNNKFNQNISQWNVSSVTNMDFMFYGCSKFNQDISGWCVELILTIPDGFAALASPFFTIDKQPNWGVACI